MNLHVLHQGQQVGPFDETTLRARLTAGEFGREDLAWHEGMADWKPLREIYPALFATAAPPAGRPISPGGFLPTAAPPAPAGPFAQGGGLPYPGAPLRPAATGMPTWVKVLLAMAAVGVLLVIGIVGVIGYGAYRVQRAVTRDLHPYKTEQTTQDAPPLARETPKPVANAEAEDLNNRGFALYTAKDYAAALPLFQRAADLGHPQARHNLGVMALYGQGVPKDPTQAMGWFSKAAAQGYASSEGQLGLCYSFYDGLPHDYAKAVEWFRKAAAQDDPQAVNNLAAMYEDGLGVPKDLPRAREVYQRAAKLGYDRAKQNIARLDAAASPTTAPPPATTPAATRAPAATGSPFAGRWQGPWNDPTANQRGTFLFTVATDGSFQGETRNDTSHATGPLRGTLDADGNLRASYSYSGNNVAGTYTAEGRLNRQGARLVGNIGFFEHGRRFGGASVDLTGSGTPAAAPGDANAGGGSGELTAGDKTAMMQAVVAYLKAMKPNAMLEGFTGPVLSREDNVKINTDTNTDLQTGAKTKVYTVVVPAKFQKGNGSEKFTLARTRAGTWEVDDYARELKPAGR